MSEHLSAHSAPHSPNVQDVAEAARTVALTVAVRAVQRGIMSRRQAADELHMHSNTFQRYLDDPDYSR